MRDCAPGVSLLRSTQHIGDHRCSLLIVSFQAAHTLGLGMWNSLADGVSPVRIFGEPFDVRLQVHTLPTFNAHADELWAWVRRIPKVGRVLCVHGERRQSEAFAGRLVAQNISAQVPERGEHFTN